MNCGYSLHIPTERVIMCDADLAPADLRCPITWDYFDDPVTLPCCGRTFSREPLRTIFEGQSTPRCPMCHGEGSVEQLQALPRSISLAYLCEEAKNRGSSAAERPGQDPASFTARFQVIAN